MRMFLFVAPDSADLSRVKVFDASGDQQPHFGVEIDVTREEIVGLDESSFCERYLVAGVCQIKNKLVEG